MNPNLEMLQSERSLFFEDLRDSLRIGRLSFDLDIFDRDRSGAFSPYSLEEAQLLFDAVSAFSSIGEVTLDAIWDVLNYEVEHSEIDGYWTRQGSTAQSDQCLIELRKATLDNDNCWSDRINDSVLPTEISSIRIFKDPSTLHTDFIISIEKALTSNKYSETDKLALNRFLELLASSRIV